MTVAARTADYRCGAHQRRSATRPARVVQWLEENVDETIAAEPQAPRRVVVGTCVARHDSRATFLDIPRLLGQIGLEASAAHDADRRAIDVHDHSRADSSITGARSRDRRESDGVPATGCAGQSVNYGSVGGHVCNVCWPAGQSRFSTVPVPGKPAEPLNLCPQIIEMASLSVSIAISRSLATRPSRDSCEVHVSAQLSGFHRARHDAFGLMIDLSPASSTRERLCQLPLAGERVHFDT